MAISLCSNFPGVEFPMAEIALVTARAARGLDNDLPPLQDALRDAGSNIAVIDWDDADVDWSRFDLALLRSTWDYTERVEEFLDWAQRAAAQTRLVNPLGVRCAGTPTSIIWHDLGTRRHLATVPSVFVESR